MKLQHYIGGLQNLGPVNTDTRVFAEEWEKRIFGIHTVMMAESAHLPNARPKYDFSTFDTSFKEFWTWASLRTGAEGMQPFEYFKFRYYEKWLMGITQFFIDQGYITEKELTEKISKYANNPKAELPAQRNPELANQVRKYLTLGDSARQPRKQPAKFSVGDRVLVADPQAVEHTRLPGFLRNKPGVVELVYPDSYAYFVKTGDGIGEAMPVYQVAFEPEVMWGDSAHEDNVTVYADLFEAYLLPSN
ncbi:MAG TPA: nitrile hydratase subunit beta [Oxalicibacterium sp.]|uniref:nitrile hydratase subunit beta n=1 Tax=Oxalicibacterium sp. TaxID=2766525 RepID=UPI002C0F704C|nr:nitrile hydratase subunit beta [Oxalicibacterium sp.]HWU97598.1 nitrile hydratase subunit beta [Oxalicibacterium sp.]